ncbi:MAG: hypothetical protein JWQ81_4499 [Amycolatopsis sp.]|uniref:alpha/beta hydrolase n=1 Tax=Amycolatopsis sp. TaxID=37632 RepID=UPI002636E032|nr:alpha/beta hydrolase [Amycolatopsis sp.]MCU1683760.1 hypothetical protein [Amycolatopsis sp.]
MTADGYRVAPAALDSAAEDLDGRAGALTTTKSSLSTDSFTAEAFGRVSNSESAFAQWKKTTTELAGKLDEQVNRVRAVQAGLTACAAGYRRTDTQIAAMYRALIPEDPLPSVGKTAGGTAATAGAWAGAIADNRIKVSDALTAERGNLAKLQATGGDAAAIAKSQQRISLYEDILANNRQILKFDPAGTGRIAELIGTIQPGTRDVGLFVPGVHTSLDNYQTYADLGKSLVAADPTGRTAMVVWADGTFPQNVAEQGTQASYTHAMAPNLKSFGDDLQNQIATHAGSGVMVTGIGHSYGAPTMELAEQQGLKIDQTVLVEPAGMGNGVWGPGDLPPSQAGVHRFSMTAPLDPIIAAQGTTQSVPDLLSGGVTGPISQHIDSWSGLGHGADPDTFPGVTDLETGRGADGNLLWGLSAHDDVLKPGSDSWNNIYGVMTGGPTTPAGSVVPHTLGEAAVEAAGATANALLRSR